MNFKNIVMVIEMSNIVRVGVKNRINNTLPYRFEKGKFVLITNKTKKIMFEAIKVYWLTPQELSKFNKELKIIDEIQMLLNKKIELMREFILTK